MSKASILGGLTGGALGKLIGISLVGNLIAKVFFAIGFSFVTYKGLDLILSKVTDEIHTLSLSLPIDSASMLGLADVDLMINMVMAGYSARLAMFALKKVKIL